ncbi:MAG: hypothetical protein IJE43_18640 [Alphaproteobacteria bacterium]|nr:hypothetical protein [Alphaproteobacteria bacterium]
MKTSKVTKDLLEYIEDGVKNIPYNPVHTLNALGSGPLAYRTFGGNFQKYSEIDEEVLEKAFGSHYLLTMIAQGILIKNVLYKEKESRHTLYCDSPIKKFFEKHGLLEHKIWDRVDTKTLEDNINPQNTDYRIYYSYSKPDALLQEAKETEKNKFPVFFIDTDLILKKRHDAIIPNSTAIRAAYSHLEEVGNICYPDFTTLNFPKGYKLPKINNSLPAVNTCLMFFNDKELLKEWGSFFKELFIDNWIEGELTPEIISKQLLGIDQRTFPFVCDWHGIWNSSSIVPFIDITWDPPHFRYIKDKSLADWHYYTLEHHPEHKHWYQDIMHTWINKKNVERDDKFRRYQGLIMLEIILYYEPKLEKALRSFNSLGEYFVLYDTHKSIEELIDEKLINSKIDKTL